MTLPSADAGVSPRQLLIALNAAEDLPRAAICSLGTQLDRWWGAAAGGRHKGLVSGKHLATARAIATRAASIARREEERHDELGATVLTWADSGYPAALRDLALPPPVLYCRGRLATRPAIAIVGSRRSDAYGLEVAELFGRELGAAGLTVVSGFARGVDTAAHRGALAGGGPTVAVLGCSHAHEYPRGSRSLADRVVESGALITEFPADVPPRPQNFPIRNRIIAALSLGTLVVRAVPRSGSLITARHALELGRDVYGVPGPIFRRRSAGPNSLIRDGALLVQQPRDILESLPFAVLEQLQPTTDGEAPGPPVPATLAALLRHLPQGIPATPEELSSRAGLTIDRVLGLLLELELGGWVRRHPGPTWGRSR